MKPKNLFKHRGPLHPPSMFRNAICQLRSAEQTTTPTSISYFTKNNKTFNDTGIGFRVWIQVCSLHHCAVHSLHTPSWARWHTRWLAPRWGRGVWAGTWSPGPSPLPQTGSESVHLYTLYLLLLTSRHLDWGLVTSSLLDLQVMSASARRLEIRTWRKNIRMYFNLLHLPFDVHK